MKIKFIAALVAFTPFFASATSITFKGEVSSQTCAATVDGQSNAIVTLPTVGLKELATVGSTTGFTPFKIDLTGCAPSAANVKISTNFSSTKVSAAGNLKNVAMTNAANNVELQLLDDSVGGTAIALNGITKIQKLELAPLTSSTSHMFAVQYISEEGAATAGPVEALVDYTITYN